MLKIHNSDIFAVIWRDFIPLSLQCANRVDAIQKAKDIHERAEMNGVRLADLRAVRLPSDSDNLETLWSAD